MGDCFPAELVLNAIKISAIEGRFKGYTEGFKEGGEELYIKAIQEIEEWLSSIEDYEFEVEYDLKGKLLTKLMKKL